MQSLELQSLELALNHFAAYEEVARHPITLRGREAPPRESKSARQAQGARANGASRRGSAS
eukprot:15471211-Alexandrium_andersonii.AAC.1